MGALLIITLKTTIHLKHKRLLPRGNNKHQDRVYKEKKAEGQYRGRHVNESLHQDIRDQLSLGRSYSEIQQKLGCSRATIARGLIN
ncbi:hypothetical protein VT25_01375 [Photobacterium leiognathi subsp. mandapamensis]|nr:hypothetical protein VT25_01375 [Photobacterium leiognathi subsp. mandapamensis]